MGRAGAAIKKAIKRLIALLIIVLLCAAAWFIWDRVQDARPDAEKIEQLYDIRNLPDYSGEPSVEINGGQPEFEDRELKPEYFQQFSELDKYGRCGVAFACLDRKHMPEGERESIGMVRPSGWQLSKYDFIDNGGYLFNRCHMIGWQLTGENAEERNLITGTRYLNVEGMLPYENQVARYIRYSGNHVLYRVTPVFIDKELLARGVQIEAQSVEDHGEGICLNVYCYNVQPGVEIDYRDGENRLAEAAEKSYFDSLNEYDWSKACPAASCRNRNREE